MKCTNTTCILQHDIIRPCFHYFLYVKHFLKQTQNVTWFVYNTWASCIHWCQFLFVAFKLVFYRATRMLTANYAVARCLSNAGILSKRLHISSEFFFTTIIVFHTKGMAIFRRGPPNEDVECNKYEKSRFSTKISPSISQIEQDRAIVTMEGE